MKRFWIISTLAVLAAMIFGSMLHRRGQQDSDGVAEVKENVLLNRAPSFVIDSPLPVQDSEMPFDYPLIPELLSEPKRSLPEVKFAATSELREQPSFPRVDFSTEKRNSALSLKKLVTTVNLSKLESEVSEAPETEVEVEIPTDPPAAQDGRFFPIVLYLGSEEGKLVLQGSIPTRENTDAVIAAAVKLVGEDAVENHLKYSPETLDAAWVDYLPEYIEKFFGHSAGDQELIVVDGILKLRGDVPSENSRNGLIALANSFREQGLQIDHELEVKESLAGDLPELAGTYASIAEASTEPDSAEPEEAIELAMLDTAVTLSIGEDAKSRSATILADELELKSEVEVGTEPEPGAKEAPDKKFVGPAESPEEWAAAIKKEQEALAAAEAAKIAAEKAAAKAKAEEVAAALAAAEKKKAEMEAAAKAEAEQKAADLAAAEKKKAETEAAEAAAKEAKLAAMIEAGERIPDDGKPLIFYFESGSSEIISSDREKIARAIQRAKIPRSIVYITAYADSRGGYESNRKLSLERAEKVRGLIFAGDIAEEVTADIKAKGESNSASNKSEEAMRRSRRVVVEVYHLKR